MGVEWNISGQSGNSQLWKVCQATLLRAVAPRFENLTTAALFVSGSPRFAANSTATFIGLIDAETLAHNLEIGGWT
jgi:hypothetical protein